MEAEAGAGAVVMLLVHAAAVITTAERLKAEAEAAVHVLRGREL